MRDDGAIAHFLEWFLVIVREIDIIISYENLVHVVFSSESIFFYSFSTFLSRISLMIKAGSRVLQMPQYFCSKMIC